MNWLMFMNRALLTQLGDTGPFWLGQTYHLISAACYDFPVGRSPHVCDVNLGGVKMTSFVKTIAAAFVVAVVGTAAHAASFDFTDQYRPSQHSFTVYGDDGLSVTVSGGAYSDGKRTVRTHEGYGLSVGYHMIDTNEYTKFEFNKYVSLHSFYAGYVDKYDDYRVYAYIAGDYHMIQTGDFGVSNYSGGNYDRASVYMDDYYVAKHFVIGVDDHYDDFKIRHMTVKMSEVPLPAGGLLLLSGLGLLAYRRKTS